MTLKPFFAATALTLATTSLAHAGQLHVFTSDASGFNTHSVWYDDGKEVTVVDTQFLPQIAQKLVDDIKRQTKSPITRIIVTHPSPDKFNALSVFHQLGAKSISSIKTAQAIAGVDAYKRYFWVKIAKSFTEKTYPQVEAIQTTFSGKQLIRLKSGETISLFELKHAGIASNQVVVRIDKTGDLIVGDLVHSKNHAWLEGGIADGKANPDLAGWKAALNELPALGKGKVYGGRGAFLPVKQAVAEQLSYLDKADEIVDTYITGLGDQFSELSDPTKQSTHYAAIQAKFVNAYPSYAMPDLIGYSVYGLVQKKIAGN